VEDAGKYVDTLLKKSNRKSGQHIDGAGEWRPVNKKKATVLSGTFNSCLLAEIYDNLLVIICFGYSK
jgi:hypothetical protein